jgi:hypothetical protein
MLIATKIVTAFQARVGISEKTSVQKQLFIKKGYSKKKRCN